MADEEGKDEAAAAAAAGGAEENAEGTPPPEEPTAAEEPKAEEGKPEENKTEEGGGGGGQESASKKKSKSKSKTKIFEPLPVPVQTEDELNREKAKCLETLPKIMAANGPTKINDEDYLTVRLMYQLFREKELATGTHSKFYKAKDKDGKEQIMKVTAMGSDVPLKYKEHLNQVATKVVRFLMTNPHPNICPAYEMFITTTKLYTFMEIIHGPNSDHWCKKSKHKESSVKKVCRDVAEGMNFLASLGIAHGAINTTHVMLNKEKNAAKLVGFGHAVLTWDAKTEQMAKCKKKPSGEWKLYMPPESVKEEYYPLLSDVWGFGTLIVALLTKKYPFELKTSNHEKHYKVFLRRYAIHPSKELQDLLNKIFVDSSKRLTLYAMVQHPWLKRFLMQRQHHFDDIIEEIESNGNESNEPSTAEIMEMPDVEYPSTEPIIIRGNGNMTLFGLSNTFTTDYPCSLIGRVSKEEFETTIGRINSLLRQHHSTNAKLLLLGCLCCCCSFGCSLLWPTLALSKRTRNALEKLLASENQKLYHKLGLNWKLSKERCHSNHAFMEYVLLIDFIPKLHIHQPD